MSIVLVRLALLMIIPALLAWRHVGEGAGRHILPGMFVARGAVIAAVTRIVVGPADRRR